MFFQHRPPCGPTSLVRFRKRIGPPDGVELLLAETVRAGLESGAVRPSSLERVSVDATVQPKGKSPIRRTAGSYHRALEVLVRQAKRAGLKLRQSYLRLARRASTPFARLQGPGRSALEPDQDDQP